MASKRRLRRQCAGKRHHATQAEAWAHADYLRRKNGSDKYHAYKCGFGHWHAGRRTEGQMEARAAS